ncbi:MAG: dihydroorotase, partial [Clostridia bacterium]|nr:dihydroorotase [Clostridia bacterium]
RCVSNLRLLEEAMKLVKECGGIIASHSEAEGYSGTETESVAVERETELAIKTGCAYHFCHLSTKKSFAAVRAAKKAGADITCEVMPHHLFLDEEDIRGDTNAKMAPPLRSAEDRTETLTALLDGTADMIATDHAPHAPHEKAMPFLLAPNGIIGFETLMPLVYTGLVKTGLATYSDMQNWVTVNPSKRFGIPYGEIKEGGMADIAVLDIDNAHRYDKQKTLSKSNNTPFDCSLLYGTNMLTVSEGKVVYDNNRRIK